MKTLEHLKAMRELLSDKSRWTQGGAARDKDGVSVRPTDEEACSWCLVGAAWKVTVNEKQFDKTLDSLRKAGDLNFLSAFNDTHSHSEVLQLLDKAINA